MACLTDFIGLRGVCTPDPVPESGLFINDMPVGGLDRLEGLSTKEQTDFAQVWAKIQTRSIAMFKSDVRKMLPIRVRSNDILDSTITGDWLDPKVNVGNTARWTGVFVKLYGSPSMVLNVPFIRLWVSANGTAPIRIWDVQTGQSLYNVSHAVTAGENILYLKVNLSTMAGIRRVFIAVNNAGLTLADADTSGCGQVRDLMQIQGAYVTNVNTAPLEANLTKTSSNSGGLIAGLSLRCELDWWICANRMALANALLLKMVVEIYREQLEADSIINRYTLLASEEIGKRINSYMEQYVNELSGVLQQIPITDAVCFECSHPVQTQYSHG